MWRERKELLNRPIDFLKAGHHGSHTATLWNRHADADNDVNRIFDAILPLPAPGTEPRAKCVVSTKRKQYETTPDVELLAELGRRVSNTRSYLTHFQEEDASFDPDADVFNYSVLKEYSKESSPRQVGDKGSLDAPQPWRTDMQSAGRDTKNMIDAVEFIDVLLDPPG